METHLPAACRSCLLCLTQGQTLIIPSDNLMASWKCWVKKSSQWPLLPLPGSNDWRRLKGAVSVGWWPRRHKPEWGQSLQEDTRLRVQSHDNPRRPALETMPGKRRWWEGDRWCRKALVLLRFYWGCRRTLCTAAMNKWFSITICQGTKPIHHYYLFTQAIMQVNTHATTYTHAHL